MMSVSFTFIGNYEGNNNFDVEKQEEEEGEKEWEREELNEEV